MHRLPEADPPWMMRTYAGHSTARRSNELYRGNLGAGQTGLSVAFDLPTQTGYDADHELARGEVGKVGVPVCHKGDMHALMDGIPLDRMNTSMTINATAAWLLALYVVTAEENGIEPRVLQGTTQNDIIKEYLSRGTYAFPPAPSMRLIADMVAYTVEHIPRWNPINVCSYHLQEAGATPVQEIAYAMSTAIAVLDEVRPRVGEEKMGAVFGRISFFVNAGVRFVEEHAKLRAMSVLWDGLGRERYGVADERHRRFRYGVQVNSLGLTESQPENNVQRIVLEALAVTLGRAARARAIQLPAWNEALGLPRPWDQQWSLRIQQVLAFETDLLEYPDLFEGSTVMEGLVGDLLAGARAEMARVTEHGGAVEAVPYMKAALVESNRERIARIESGEQVLVGVNRFTETASSPLTADAEGGILVVDKAVEEEQKAALAQWRAGRDHVAVHAALEDLALVARSEENVMPATIAAARAGATTGEWAAALRGAFGSYRAPTGIGAAAAPAPGADIAALRDDVAELSEQLGRNLKILVGKPGLDGHSNGAEQIAVRAR
ncbi:MAG TPA: methylmalonyl-CoA mutase family protein, partial [Solirubrobacteraceae bacterium]|nr:methylmalonyl-CoA mutase family protein [Solirubrobacteraceae bacterium]